MATHNHEKADQSLSGKIDANSGYSDFSKNFKQWSEVTPTFDITCAGCCWEYLHSRRGYSTAKDARMVKFKTPVTSCYVDGVQSRNGKNGVVKTGTDINLGKIGPRPVDASHSYQLYGKKAPSGLAVGAHMTARIEAIAVTKLISSDKVEGCYFNYADAALLELYREKEGKPSLEGQCCWPTEDQRKKGKWLSDRMAELNLTDQDN